MFSHPDLVARVRRIRRRESAAVTVKPTVTGAMRQVQRVTSPLNPP